MIGSEGFAASGSVDRHVLSGCAALEASGCDGERSRFRTPRSRLFLTINLRAGAAVELDVEYQDHREKH